MATHFENCQIVIQVTEIEEHNRFIAPRDRREREYLSYKVAKVPDGKTLTPMIMTNSIISSLNHYDAGIAGTGYAEDNKTGRICLISRVFKVGDKITLFVREWME